MNIKEISTVLPYLLKNRIVPFFWGNQGVGKTQTMKQYCEANGLQMVTLMLATQDVGDLIGLLVKGDNGEVYHAKPNWFPTEGTGIVFLDEANRAPTDVLQAMFSFVQNGKLHTHTLPEGWRVVAAGNYNNDKFVTNQMSDAAWMSRFTHIDFRPTTEEFLMYAESVGMKDLASFIRERPEMLESTDSNSRLDFSFISPDRRAYMEYLGKIDLEKGFPDELRYELYSGMVGTAAAAAFLTWKGKKEKPLSLNEILDSYDKTTKNKIKDILLNKEGEVRLDLLNQPIDELITKIDSNPDFLSNSLHLENIKSYLVDIPRELAMKAFVAFAKLKNFKGKDAILNDREYVAKFGKDQPKKKKKEKDT